MAAVSFFYNEVRFTLLHKKKLKSFLPTVFEKHRLKLMQLTYVFCTDAYLLTINKAFLKHDTYTDIITFNLSDKKHDLIGEVYISIDRVKENAQLLGSSFKEELHRVIFHGALHLCGHNDKSARQKATMRKLEDYYMTQYFK
jgi:probable rRNA maturation factor